MLGNQISQYLSEVLGKFPNMKEESATAAAYAKELLYIIPTRQIADDIQMQRGTLNLQKYEGLAHEPSSSCMWHTNNISFPVIRS